MKQTFLLGVLIMILTGCGSRGSGSAEQLMESIYKPRYAGGFELFHKPGSESTLLKLSGLWQGADTTASQYLFISRGGEQAPDGFKGQTLIGDAKRIVCMSSSQIAMLDALGAVDRVVGVSGIDFISNKAIQAGRDTIADVGYDGNIDFERLVSLRPDLVMLYGVEGANPIEPKLRELGIPFVYIGEYMEQSPLGKAEWLVAVGEMIGRRDSAERVFDRLPHRYDQLKQLASCAASRPKVMLNTPYNDAWVMPSTRSYAVRLINDAAADYLYSQNTGTRSVPIDMEQAYSLLNQADVWINTGQFTSLASLKAAYPKLADTRPVVTGNVWNNNLRASPGGGSDYWESGAVNPDLILADLIAIFHPELADSLPGRTYYRSLASETKN
ncbi:MAG: ABC transporter substrate-binding protein [Muribaculaceae bacterium]|nr:ABC transporter substrate-binding protein [Muribaculaceae bacterium]